MGYPQDLLAQATYLVSREKKKPKQASLRRAVSTAYYALFHLLSQEAADRLSPVAPAKLNNVIRRTLNHGDMKSSAKGIVANQPPKQFDGLLSSAVSSHLKSVASHFVDLQEQRHIADYDVSVKISRIFAKTMVDNAADAFQKWQLVRTSSDANVFLASMLLWKNFNTR